MVAAVLPLHSNLFRIRARSDRTSRSIKGNWDGNLAPAAMSTVLRGWLRSGEVNWSATVSVVVVSKRGRLRSSPNQKYFSHEATTTIHFCVSRVGRGPDPLELSISASQAAAAERQHESASRPSITAIERAKFSTSNRATQRDCDTGASATKRFTRTHA